ncbi:hypothetical protein [Neolewinella antarctica]|uniref:Tryptophan-rich sensory protein n=1 Tax=Neolewinella antarctica TaxID=442734 RepID=A0ABX0X918_9BACT|nr:hypothetical protein [Neolewinella antarctica]NJC25722.1 hypothetical protein [Neolewinella antarctica]
MTHRTSRFVALGGLLTLAALYAMNSLGYLGPNPIGSTSRATAPLIVPAGYAFAIWGPIYIGLLIFPIYQLFKKREEHPAWIELRLWYAANVVANGVWLALASYDQVWSTVAVIVFMLVSLFRINVLLNRIEAAGAPVNYWLERFVFYVYFAWVTLATVLNVASDLDFTGWDGGPLSAVTWTVVMMLVAAGIAGFTAWRFGSAAYAGVVVWAFVAICVKHAETYSTIFYVALAVAVLFSVLGVRLFSQPRLKMA